MFRSGTAPKVDTTNKQTNNRTTIRKADRLRKTAVTQKEKPLGFFGEPWRLFLYKDKEKYETNMLNTPLLYHFRHVISILDYTCNLDLNCKLPIHVLTA